jgi:imidazolonepropionase-like amidohydrolase
MITLSAAENLGIGHRVGSIEVGKDGDIAIFSHYPLHTPALVEMTIIEGEVYFDRNEADIAADWVFQTESGEEGGR